MHAWRARCRRAAIGRAGSLRDRHHGGDGVRQGHGRHRDRRDADLIDHGENGLLVPAGDVAALRDAMQRLSTTAPCSAVWRRRASRGWSASRPARSSAVSSRFIGRCCARRRTRPPCRRIRHREDRRAGSLRQFGFRAHTRGAAGQRDARHQFRRAGDRRDRDRRARLCLLVAGRPNVSAGSDRQRVRPAIRHQSDGPAGRGGARHPAGR